MPSPGGGPGRAFQARGAARNPVPFPEGECIRRIDPANLAGRLARTDAIRRTPPDAECPYTPPPPESGQILKALERGPSGQGVIRTAHISGPDVSFEICIPAGRHVSMLDRQCDRGVDFDDPLSNYRCCPSSAINSELLRSYGGVAFVRPMPVARRTKSADLARMSRAGGAGATVPDPFLVKLVPFPGRARDMRLESGK